MSPKEHLSHGLRCINACRMVDRTPLTTFSVRKRPKVFNVQSVFMWFLDSIRLADSSWGIMVVDDDWREVRLKQCMLHCIQMNKPVIRGVKDTSMSPYCAETLHRTVVFPFRRPASFHFAAATTCQCHPFPCKSLEGLYLHPAKQRHPLSSCLCPGGASWITQSCTAANELQVELRVKRPIYFPQ